MSLVQGTTGESLSRQGLCHTDYMHACGMAASKMDTVLTKAGQYDVICSAKRETVEILL